MSNQLNKLSLEQEVQQNKTVSGLKKNHEARAKSLKIAVESNAFISLDENVINGEMPSLTANNSPLFGLVFSCKDNINTRQFPTTVGTPSLRNFYPAKSASIISKLESLGAKLCGKNNMHELSFGVTSYNHYWGNVLNPKHPSYIAGGSSGGSAVAVVTGACSFSVGTDTGGSVRIPAALCGLTGFRPSTNRYPSDGVFPVSSTKDTPGLIAKSVEDICLLDASIMNTPKPNPKKPKRVGIPSKVLWGETSDNISSVCTRILTKLKNDGIELIEFDDSLFYEKNQLVQFPVPFYEFFIDFPRFLLNQNIDTSLEDIIENLGDEAIKSILRDGISESSISKSDYILGLSTIRELRNDWTKLFLENNFDLVIYPTIASDIPHIEQAHMPEIFQKLVKNTDLASTLGIPSITVPIARENELSVGLSIDGLVNEDYSLLEKSSYISALINKA